MGGGFHWEAAFGVSGSGRTTSRRGACTLSRRLGSFLLGLVVLCITATGCAVSGLDEDGKRKARGTPVGAVLVGMGYEPVTESDLREPDVDTWRFRRNVTLADCERGPEDDEAACKEFVNNSALDVYVARDGKRIVLLVREGVIKCRVPAEWQRLHELDTDTQREAVRVLEPLRDIINRKYGLVFGAGDEISVGPDDGSPGGLIWVCQKD